MDESIIILDWTGPYTLDELFASPDSAKCGIYLFTVQDKRHRKKRRPKRTFFVAYAGYTRQPFRKRLRQHLSNYRRFKYYILDMDKLQQGKRVELWD